MQLSLFFRTSLIIVSLSVLGFACPLSVTSQGADAGSTPETVEESRSFEFFPTETGWGTVVDVTIEPGKSVDEQLVLGNTGSVTQEISVYRTNADTAEGGGLVVADSNANVDHVASWLSLDEGIHTVNPGMGVEFTVRISVPDNAEPGEYVTAVAAEHAESLEIDGSEILRQKIRYVVPIFITVPGPTEANLELGEVSFVTDGDQVFLRLEVTNGGNIHLRPEGSISISDVNGDLVASFPVTMGIVFAGDQTTLLLSVPDSIGIGIYDIRAELSDEDDGLSYSAEVQSQLEASSASPVASSTIAIASAIVEPSPSPNDLQFVNVDALIVNDGEQVTNAQLSLVAYLNGEEVERFPISQSLSLDAGETEVTTRYIPAMGWTSGEWTFELLLETVDSSGAAVVVASEEIEDEVVVP